MFIINEDKSIYITRGDVASFSVEATADTGKKYKFMPGDIVRFKVFEKNACENVVLSKDFGIEAETEDVSIYLDKTDTKIGEVISKPEDYWYEVELNPFNAPQTIIGFDDEGAKVFRIFPEGNETENEEPVLPEDIPVVDEELDLTSTRPVQNQAISRAILKNNEDVQTRMDEFEENIENQMENRKVKTSLVRAIPSGYVGEYELWSLLSDSVFNYEGDICILRASIISNEDIYCSRFFRESNTWKVVIKNRTSEEKYELPSDVDALMINVYCIDNN